MHRDRDAGDDRSEGCCEGKNVRLVDAGDPGSGAGGEAKPAKRHDERDPPTKAVKSFADFSRPDFPDDKREKRGAGRDTQGGSGAERARRRVAGHVAII